MGDIIFCHGDLPVSRSSYHVDYVRVRENRMCGVPVLLLLLGVHWLDHGLPDSDLSVPGRTQAANASGNPVRSGLYPFTRSTASHTTFHILDVANPASVCGAGVVRFVTFIEVGKGMVMNANDVTCTGAL
jgi:hypothetical protein